MNEMNIIGIHDGHNSSVALYKRGELCYALQEERISREKNASGFPVKAFYKLFEDNSLKIDDIDRFFLVSNHMTVDPGVSTRDIMKKRFEDSDKMKRVLKDWLRNTKLYEVKKKRLDQNKIKECVKNGIPKDRLKIVEHHSAHSNTAYYCSPFEHDDKVLVITSDGGGDKLSCTVSVGEKGRIERKNVIPDSDSLSKLYSGVTYYMGMVPNEHEYKIMGLAPYSKKEEYRPILEEFRNILYFEDQNSLIYKRGVHDTTFRILPILDRILKRKRFDLIAGALQEFTEETICELIRRNLKYYDVNKVALSGGLFMNVKANKHIMEMEEVQDMFVMPSCGDETNSIGAALDYYARTVNHKSEVQPLGKDYCLGPSNQNVSKELKKWNQYFKIQYFDDIERKVATLLSENNVVARVKGNIEFGARALGHRSILANPSSYENVKLINDMIKKRDFWMPFAGSFLEESMEEYIVNPKGIPSPFMILTFDSVEEKRHDIEGALHPQDKTTRPQIVNKESDPDYWKLINEFKKETGIGCILNTSFNLHGLPVAHSVDDSMYVLDNSGLKYLALENYLIFKEE